VKKRSRPHRKKTAEHVPRCWEFFRCDPLKQQTCLIKDVESSPCWLVNVVCCRMPADAGRPISVKKVICKSCVFYLYIHKEAR